MMNSKNREDFRADMKLKSGFVLHTIGEEHMVVATGEAAKTFNGLVRNNETANFIFEQLMEETTEEQIIAKICEQYEAPIEVVTADVKRVVNEIRQAGFLEES